VSINLAAAHNLPLHVSSIGKVHLAFLPAAETNRILNRPLRSYTPNTMSNPVMLQSTIRQIRQQGYATSDGELEVGAKSVSAPVFFPVGQVAAALTVAGPAFRLTAPAMRRLIPRVVTAAHRITKCWNQKFPRGANGLSFPSKFSAQSPGAIRP